MKEEDHGGRQTTSQATEEQEPMQGPEKRSWSENWGGEETNEVEARYSGLT